jgi:chitinase
MRKFCFVLLLITQLGVLNSCSNDFEARTTDAPATNSPTTNAPDSTTGNGTSNGTSNGTAKITSAITLAYFPSWSETWTSPGKNSKLRELPSYVNTVFLAFGKPNLRYVKGSYDISNTGIGVPYDGKTLAESIRVLKAKNIKVILSIGGETYWNDAYSGASATCYDIKYEQIKDLVDDFSLAGIDWDYEPAGQISILSEVFHVNKYIEFITKSRSIMPKGSYLIAVAPSGVGALGGVGPQPAGIDDLASPYNQAYGKSLGSTISNAASVGASSATLFGFASSGHFIPVMKSVGTSIDIVAYQGYNVGGSIDRKVMYDAYSYYGNQYGFVVVAGVHVANEPWGPFYTFSNNNVGDLAEYIYNGGKENRKGSKDGIMLWELLATDQGAYKNTGLGFMKLSYEILNGTTKNAAILNAATATTSPYTGGSEEKWGGAAFL